MAAAKFSFFPDDWLAGTMTLTAAERGAYIDLLATCWSVGAITEAEALAAGRADAETVRAVLAKKFRKCDDGRWINHRLERERKKSRTAPKLTGDERKADQRGLIPSETIGVQAVTERALAVFPCRGMVKTWELTESQVEAWEGLFPGVDVRGECLKALAWVQANGGKTSGGMTRFLVSWLNRATDSRAGKIVGAVRATMQPTFKQVDQSERERMLERLRKEEERGGDDFDGYYLTGGK